MLEVRSVTKHLGSFILPDLSMVVQPGEYFVLLGPSGVGKTVLLEIIAGLMPPDNGQILWQGRDITRAPPEARGFAVVYQDYALFPHLTVARNIAYGLHICGARSSEINSRVHALTDMLDLERLLPRHPESLSGGEQQRVALARALVTRPQMLLLDEPLSALDINTRWQLRKELKRIHKQMGTTFLHITHDATEAMVLGDRIGVMLNNRICQEATPEELFRSPSDAEVAKFLGLRNVMAIDAIRDNACRVHGVDIRVAGANGDISHLWIRPEEILLSRKPFDSSARNQFKCKVEEVEPGDKLLTVRVSIGQLSLSVLVTYASFQELNFEVGSDLYVTFKSSAIHCF